MVSTQEEVSRAFWKSKTGIWQWYMKSWMDGKLVMCIKWKYLTSLNNIIISLRDTLTEVIRNCRRQNDKWDQKGAR